MAHYTHVKAASSSLPLSSSSSSLVVVREQRWSSLPPRMRGAHRPPPHPRRFATDVRARACARLPLLARLRPPLPTVRKYTSHVLPQHVKMWDVTQAPPRRGRTPTRSGSSDRRVRNTRPSPFVFLFDLMISFLEPISASLTFASSSPSTAIRFRSSRFPLSRSTRSSISASVVSRSKSRVAFDSRRRSRKIISWRERGVSRWITFDWLDNATRGARNKFSGERREGKGIGETGRARGTRMGRPSSCVTYACIYVQRLPPFVEKGRRNYVVAQLMRPRATIIW